MKLNEKPGLLALAMEKKTTSQPGRRSITVFRSWCQAVVSTSSTDWDSYMESLGLLVNDRVDLAKGMVINFCFEIKHYGKILNANRSYYLTRSQPPFLTDMALRVYERIKTEPDSREFLRNAVLAASRSTTASGLLRHDWTPRPVSRDIARRAGVCHQRRSRSHFTAYPHALRREARHEHSRTLSRRTTTRNRRTRTGRVLPA